LRLDQNHEWPRQLKSRRRLLREFRRWYKSAQQDFEIKLKFLRRTDTCIYFSFIGLTPIIAGSIFPTEILIDVTWDNKCWNLLACIEIFPIRIPAGFVCSECDPETRPILPTVEMRWRIELFQAFQDWVNYELAPASYLSIEGLGGITTARLVE
jgi:hypothetical protein